MNFKKRVNSSWTDVPHYISGTDTETITTLPATIYPLAQTATVGLKGNTTQSGTPTPSAPVPVVGVGDLDNGQIKIPISSANTTTPVYLGEVQTTRTIRKYEFTGNENWSFSAYPYLDDFTTYSPNYLRRKINICVCSHLQTSANVQNGEAIAANTCCFNNETTRGLLYYKDTSVSDLASFKSWLQQQYTAGTPVTVWYVLAEPETGIVNEPLRKIGDYADEVSGITIPTIAGADGFDVLTTLKPSEVTVNYHGWHPVADVHEKSKNLFDYKTAYAQYLSGDDVVITPLQMLAEKQYFTSDEVGTTITISVYAKTVTSTRVFIRANINGVNVDSNSVLSGNSGAIVVTVTPKSTSDYFILTYGDSGGYNTFNQFMLNTGSTALPYEPYWK